MHGGSHSTARGPRQAHGPASGACEGVHHGQVARDGLLGARAARRQRHPRRLQRCTLLRGRRGALFLRRNVSDAAPDRRQGGHRVQRLRVRRKPLGARRYPSHPPAGVRPSFGAGDSGDIVMASPATGTLTPSPTVVPASPSKAALTLVNVLYEKRSGIAYVTLNRPKVLNALNTPTWKDLRTAFEDARDDMAVHGVILTGAGDKAFIAGADIGELAHASAIDAERSSRIGQEVLDLVENLGKPVIAAIN